MALAHSAYRLLSRLMVLPMLGWLWWRGRREPGYRERLHERLGWLDVHPENLGGVWIHAASVGEVQAVSSLVDALCQQLGSRMLTLSCQTPTGAVAARALWPQTPQQLYFPLDTPGACARFLDRLQPQLLILVERELWPEMLAQCRARAVPVVLINARLSARSAQTYQRCAALMRPVWSQLALVAAADNASAECFQQLGVPAERLLVSGNLKFDTAVPLAKPEWEDTAASLRSRNLVLAGSTHEGEESAILDAWPEFQRRHPSSLLVLAPRHPHRFDTVADMLVRRAIPFVRHSSAQVATPATQVILGDTMGDLVHWYSVSAVCFVGGSLAPIGGHNALEALGRGKPVLFGPHTHNFAQLYDQVLQYGAGELVANATALFAAAERWLARPAHTLQMGQAASQFVAANQGASARTLERLHHLLPLASTGPVGLSGTNTQSIWHDADLLSRLNAHDFQPNNVSRPALALPTGSGRGQAYRVDHDGRQFVLRRYQRGGVIARFNRDAFLRTGGTAQSRAMQEFALLRKLQSWSMPVPRAGAAQFHRQGLVYRAAILVEWIADSRNVAQILAIRSLTPSEWFELGRAIRLLHQRGVFHSDLNCHNLLLDAAGRAWVVDFDKCGVRPDGPWKQANLERLARSLRKEARKNPQLHWTPADWPLLLNGYGDQRWSAAPASPSDAPREAALADCGSPERA